LKGERMKKVVKVILFVVGLLLVIAFFASIAYDYYLINTRIFAVPLGIQFTVIVSGILFLIPGIICIVLACIIKRKEAK
jgi:hypothetical protein